MPIVWRDTLSVDHGVIDKDHRHLIDLINSMEHAVTANRSIRELQNAMDQLAVYTQRHFSREEEIMIARRYARFDEHKAQHLRLIDELSDAAQPVRAAKDLDSPVASVLERSALDRLTDLQRHWLLDHIIKEDLKLKALLA